MNLMGTVLKSSSWDIEDMKGVIIIKMNLTEMGFQDHR
jgi:hypothetical protein